MPRETKEQKELNINKKESIKKTTKTTKIADTPKSNVANKKVTSAKKEPTKPASKFTATRKFTSKKVTSSKTKKTTNKKVISKKAVYKTITKKPEVVEYYDLPYRYNQTIVKLLAQTPTTLFVYWDINDTDRENYKKQYGDNFFETTKPVLIVHNDTLDYSFEVDINDFANSWYLQVNDSKCDYRVELGRHPITYMPKLDTNYIFISESNEIESPNDKILFDKFPRNVTFRNLKTKNEYSKTISDINVKNSLTEFYDIYDLYKLIFNDENIDTLCSLSNPSSGNPSSDSISSKFK